MRQVYLLENYNNYNKGDIIKLPINRAKQLISEGIARVATNRDFLVKPIFGIAKAFLKPPSGRGFKKINK